MDKRKEKKKYEADGATEKNGAHQTPTDYRCGSGDSRCVVFPLIAGEARNNKLLTLIITNHADDDRADRDDDDDDGEAGNTLRFSSPGCPEADDARQQASEKDLEGLSSTCVHVTVCVRVWLAGAAPGCMFSCACGRRRSQRSMT